MCGCPIDPANESDRRSSVPSVAPSSMPSVASSISFIPSSVPSLSKINAQEVNTTVTAIVSSLTCTKVNQEIIRNIVIDEITVRAPLASHLVDTSCGALEGPTRVRRLTDLFTLYIVILTIVDPDAPPGSGPTFSSLKNAVIKSTTFAVHSVEPEAKVSLPVILVVMTEMPSVVPSDIPTEVPSTHSKSNKVSKGFKKAKTPRAPTMPKGNKGPKTPKSGKAEKKGKR
uniref:Uncharacterized protein n=1 Tax=Eucampia antarctica TaxID=49252 RepID=A0A7S2R0S9_9STRA